MQKVTIDNYKDFFKEKFNEIAELEKLDNNEVRSVAKKLSDSFKEALEVGNERLASNNVLKIGVVGQVKAGKSSFLNSLLFNGENILPRASTPMTAGLTVLEYGEANQFDVEYYNTREWATFEGRDKEYRQTIEELKAGDPSLTEKEAAEMANMDAGLISAHELVSKCSRKAKSEIQDNSKHTTRDFSSISELQDILENFVGVDGTYTSVVKCLTIKLHDERLKDIQVVDTPGVNDPIISREQRTREFLRGCHGVFFLSYSGRFFDSTDDSFLTERIGSEGIGSVVLIASKFDSVLQDVGTMFNDDLEGAIYHCQKRLKKQFEENLSKSDFNGEEPIIDFSSGIGFSISKKSPDRWDDMEKHVVKQMRRFYPSFFKSDDEARESFFNLSNIDEIQEKYLEKVFRRNKDKIIQRTMLVYFDNISNNLSRSIASSRQRLQTRFDSLKGTDLSDLRGKKEAMMRAIRNLKGNIQTICNNCDSQAERNMIECLNGFRFGNNINIPLKQESSATRKSTFWNKTKSFSIDVKIVDVNKLIEISCKELNAQLESLSKNWTLKSQQLTSQLENEIHKSISDSEKSNEHLDADVLRNILSETIESMKTKITLNVGDIVRDFRFELAQQLQGLNDVNTSCGEMEEAEARNEIKRRADEIREKVQNRWHNAVTSVVEDLKTKTRKAREESVSVLKDRKEDFFKSVENSTKDYLENLQESLRDKETQLAIYEKAIKLIDNLNK